MCVRRCSYMYQCNILRQAQPHMFCTYWRLRNYRVKKQPRRIYHARERRTNVDAPLLLATGYAKLDANAGTVSAQTRCARHTSEYAFGWRVGIELTVSDSYGGSHPESFVTGPVSVGNKDDGRRDDGLVDDELVRASTQSWIFGGHALSVAGSGPQLVAAPGGLIVAADVAPAQMVAAIRVLLAEA